MSLETAVTPRRAAAASTPAEQTPRQLNIALLVIASAQLMVILDSTIINVALPELGQTLHFSAASLQWVVTAYALSLGSLLLLGGRLGDLLGRRKTFMAGIALFALASLTGGLSGSVAVMLAARAVQGAGAALASPAALALINTTFPVGKQRHRAMAVYAMMSGVGAGVGFILGGLLTQTVGWRWTFFINVPIGLFVLLLAPRTLRESASHGSRLDVAGAVTATLGLFGIVYGLSHASERGASWTDAQTIGSLAAGLALVAVFVAIEARSASPLLPLSVLANRDRAASLVVMLLTGALVTTMFYFLGLFVQQVMGFSPLRAGFGFLPFTIAIVISSTLASQLMTRLDPRWLAGFGTLCVTIAMAGLSQLGAASHYPGGLLPWIALTGFGAGFVFTPLTLTATHGVHGSDSGAAASALNTAQQIGGALGIASLSTLFTSSASDEATRLGARAAAQAASIQAHATGSAFWGAALIGLLAVLTAIGGLRLHRDELGDAPAVAMH